MVLKNADKRKDFIVFSFYFFWWNHMYIYKKCEPNKEIFDSNVSSKISWIEMKQNQNKKKKKIDYKRIETIQRCQSISYGVSGRKRVEFNDCRIDL